MVINFEDERLKRLQNAPLTPEDLQELGEIVRPHRQEWLDHLEALSNRKDLQSHGQAAHLALVLTSFLCMMSHKIDIDEVAKLMAQYVKERPSANKMPKSQ